MKDRIYSDGGRLEKKGSWRYKYDSEGFLIQKYKGSGGLFGSKSNVWKYKWNAEGMLQTVIRPDKEEVHFTYDALGRRLSKTFQHTTTRWLWDGNIPLHEWKENARGEILSKTSVDKDGVITWVFEEESFIPTAKLKGDQQFSILADHLGTPISMFDADGKQTWERELDSFGKVKSGSHNSCPFMYQGQYYDKEIELAYNRFRYYNPEDGRYISKDPIGLKSGENNFYSYVNNPNEYTDTFGLAKTYSRAKAKRNKSRTTQFGGQTVRGFKNGGEIMERLGNLRNRLRKMGYENVQVGIRGSSITGESSKGAGEFFSNPKADIDFFAVDDSFTSKLPLDGSGSVKSKYLDEAMNDVLSEFGDQTTNQLGRKSSVRFIDSEALKAKGAFIIY